MPTHICIDPTDQYGQAEVLVAFTRIGGAIDLIAVTDAAHHDILSDLEEVQCHDLRHEIAEAFHGTDRTPVRQVAC